MSLLSRHLEQISLSSESIATLPFPPPKIFTNALLSTPDITSLIRDTEPHERALFSVPPPPPSVTSTPYPYHDPKSESTTGSKPKRRQTVFNVAAGEVTTGTSGPGNRAPRRNTAVAAVLGPELHSEVRKTEGKGAVDIEVLLRGVEKLNEVYSVPGTEQRVAELRQRYARITGSLSVYEKRVEKQTKELERMNRGEDWDDDDEEEDDEDEVAGGGEQVIEVTDEDLRREEEEIAILETRKRELDDRVKGMERDLGGLLR